MSNGLEAARAEARWIYHLYSKRRDEMKVLADLTPEVVEALQVLLGQGSDAADEVAKALAGLRAEPKLRAWAMAMQPLMAWWEAENGPVALTMPQQNPTGEGASPGLKFLTDEMSDVLGRRIGVATARTMVKHLRR